MWEHGLTTEMQEDFWAMLSHKSGHKFNICQYNCRFLQPRSLHSVGWQWEEKWIFNKSASLTGEFDKEKKKNRQRTREGRQRNDNDNGESCNLRYVQGQ